MIEKTYTLAQVKAAFWKMFHRRGEMWFNYLGSERENEDCTRDYWDDFLEALDEPAQRTTALDALVSALG